MDGIKTIIFDLGGVLVDLDVNKTIQSFAALSGMPMDEIRHIYHTHQAMTAFEVGKIDDKTFREEVRNAIKLGDDVDDRKIDDAWNAMLLGIHKRKLDYVGTLKEQYNVFILSNTNSIHIDHVYSVILPKTAGVGSFQPFVHKTYYSYHMGMRKPDPVIYQHVLNENGLTGAETIFVDDNLDNIRAAEEVGIRVRHVTDAEQVYQLTA